MQKRTFKPKRSRGSKETKVVEEKVKEVIPKEIPKKPPTPKKQVHKPIKKKAGDFKIVATTLQGLEEILAQEIRELGGSEVKVLIRAVSFYGDQALLYACNYQLRTALRILKPIFSFKANNEEELYKGAMSIWWNKFMTLEQSFAISAAVSGEIFTHSQYAALKTKDALVDQFRNRTGERPNVNTEHPDIRIHVRIEDNWVVVSLDSSGEPLFKRGYRKAVFDAPMNEVLAAGILLHGGWHGQSDLIDPMCGSGTLVIEAASIARNAAPQKMREYYCFQNWADYDEGLFNKIKRDSALAEKEFKHTIFGFDKSPKATSIARHNVVGSDLDKHIQIDRRHFEKSAPENPGSFVIMNPPYGERIKEEDLPAFYTMIGDVLKFNYAGCTACVFSAALDSLKMIGLKPEKKVNLMNGGLESRLVKFSINKGKFQKAEV